MKLFKDGNNFLLKVIKIFIPVIFFLPLYVNTDYFFSFVTPRNFIFRLIVTIVLALYLVLFIRNEQRFKPVVNKIFIVYLLLALILTVSSLINGDFLYSFWSGFERMEGLVNLYYLLAFLLVILGVYHHQKNWIFLLRVTVFVSFLISFVGLAQYLNVNLLFDFLGETRISGTLGNATFLSTYVLFHLFFTSYLLLKDKFRFLRFELITFYVIDIILLFIELKARSNNQVGPLSLIFKNFFLVVLFILPQIFLHINCYVKKVSSYFKLKIYKSVRHIYFLLIVLLNFLALFATQTRGALVGLVVALLAILIFILLSRYSSKKLKYLSIVCLLGIILSSFSIFIFKDSNFIKNIPTLHRITEISFSDTTATARLLAWETAFKGFKEKPIIGWGEEKFYVVFNKYFPTDIYKHIGSKIWFDRPHSIFIQYLVHGGILGLIAYASIFFFIFFYLFNHYKRSHDIKTITILGGLTIAYLVQNLFVFDNFNSYILLVLLLSIVIFISTPSKKEMMLTKKSINWFLPTIVLLIVFTVGYFLNMPQIKTNRNFEKYYNKITTSSFNEYNHQKIIEITNDVYLGKFEMNQKYIEYIIETIQDENIFYEDRYRMFRLGESQIEKAIKEQPDNALHWALLFNLYGSATESIDIKYADTMIEAATNGLKLSPTRTHFYYGLGKAYLVKEDYQKSIDNYFIAIDLTPHICESHLNLMSVYLTIEDLENAKQVVEVMKNNKHLKFGDQDFLEPYCYGKIAEFYNKYEYLDEAIIILEEAIVNYPNEDKLSSQLILYYNQADDIVDK